MRKALVVFVTIILSCATSAVAAEYVVKRGDTLTAIAKRVGFTPTQLAGMNDIKLSAVVVVGQKIRYFTDEDIGYAKLWCKKVMKETSRWNENYYYFQDALEDLEKKVFRFSIEEPNGLHVSSIFVYAEAWRKRI